MSLILFVLLVFVDALSYDRLV